MCFQSVVNGGHMKKISSIIVIDWKYLLIITLIVLIFFLPVFFKGWIIFPDLLDHYQPWSNYVPGLFIRYSPLRSDLVDSYLPKFNYIKTSTLQGDIPLWFDAADLGKPMSHYLSQYMFTPFIFLMWLLPVEIGFTASVILKALTAAIGMFYWLKSLGVNSGLAVGGGVAFVFSGFHISWFMAAAGTQNMMLPWVFLLADYLLSLKDLLQKYWRMLALAVVLSAILFSGFVAGAGHVLYLLGFYVLIRSIISAIKQQPKSFTEIKSVITPGLMVLASIVMAVGLAAIFLLPSIEWVEFIDVSYRKVSNASAFLPLKTLIQLGLPNYFGNPVFNNWKGVANWNETSSFVTILCLVATPIGLLYGIKKKQLTISVVGLLAILCFLIIWKITPLLSIVRKLPIFDSSSNVRLIGPLDFFLITK